MRRNAGLLQLQKGAQGGAFIFGEQGKGMAGDDFANDLVGFAL